MAAHVTRITKRRLGELLRAEGLVTEEQLKQARAEQRRSNLLLIQALVRLGFVKEEELATTIAQHFGLPLFSTELYEINPEVWEVFPAALMREYQFVPLDRLGPMVIIASAGLMSHDMLSELERLSKGRVCQYMATLSDVERTLERLGKERKAPEGIISDLGKMLFGEGGEEAVKEVAAARAAAASAPAAEPAVAAPPPALEPVPPPEAAPAHAALGATPIPPRSGALRFGRGLSAFAAQPAPKPGVPPPAKNGLRGLLKK